MKVLVTGRTGQVATSLRERAVSFPKLELAFVGRPALDLADDASLAREIRAAAPDVIVSAAAFTAVDQAEHDRAAAEQVNGRAPAAIAAAAREVGAAMIHLSTDYVFDGDGTEPYREGDAVGPASVYGKTKLAGEEGVRAALADHVIVRTAWVYSPFGKNFVRTMLAAAESRAQLDVVEDQVGNPTSAFDIADGLLAILNCWRDRPGHGTGATYHLAARGSTSWAGFARQIFEVSRSAGGPWADVKGIASEQWPTPARRPSNSRLDTSRFERVYGYAAPDWTASLEPVVKRILEERRAGASSAYR